MFSTGCVVYCKTFFMSNIHKKTETKCLNPVFCSCAWMMLSEERFGLVWIQTVEEPQTPSWADPLRPRFNFSRCVSAQSVSAASSPDVSFMFTEIIYDWHQQWCSVNVCCVKAPGLDSVNNYWLKSWCWDWDTIFWADMSTSDEEDHTLSSDEDYFACLYGSERHGTNFYSPTRAQRSTNQLQNTTRSG